MVSSFGDGGWPRCQGLIGNWVAGCVLVGTCRRCSLCLETTCSWAGTAGSVLLGRLLKDPQVSLKGLSPGGGGILLRGKPEARMWPGHFGAWGCQGAPAPSVMIPESPAGHQLQSPCGRPGVLCPEGS